jgi:hypothetical protein
MAKTTDKFLILAHLDSLGYFRAKKSEVKQSIIEQVKDLTQATERAIIKIADEYLHEKAEEKARKIKKQASKKQADSEKPITAAQETASDHVTAYPPGRYILATAQNNTDVDKTMLYSLEKFAEYNDCRILCAKTTYNLSGFQNPSDDDKNPIYYAPEITKYLVEGQIDLGGLHFIAQANVLPTAKNPLSGFEAITPAGVDCVIPATKISLKCTARLKHQQGKRLFSTGSITKRNYILRKAGAVAASEHNIGALFVDTSINPPIVRQLELMPESEGFFDDNKFFTPNGVSSEVFPTALQFGDIHAEKMSAKNLNKCLDQVAHYLPENIILHDVMDFSSRNHHNIKDCAFMFKNKGRTVAEDVSDVSGIIRALANFGRKVWIVESNHDLAINTWLKNTDFKTDPNNAILYLTCMKALYEHIEETGNSNFNMLAFVCRQFGELNSPNVYFHETDESLEFAGVECGVHGHVGINGSRGSPAQFRTLGIPLNTGHTHTPSIQGACYTAGVAGELDMGYNIGPSSWQYASILTWPNGQRQIIFN